MEQMGSLFDSCDESLTGAVIVSKLMATFMEEVGIPENGPELAEQQRLLQSVRQLLDPFGNDVQVNKVTWMAAWQKQADLRSSVVEMVSGSDLRSPDVANDRQSEGLNQSKQSYCFSPGSRSSSVESDQDDVELMKEENRQLLSQIKTLKEQCQNLEDVLIQEQAEKQEMENKFKEEINRGLKQEKCLQEREQDLKSSLDLCEKEKMELCNNVLHHSKLERQLKIQLADLTDQNTALNADMDELINLKEKHMNEIENLHLEVQQQAAALKKQSEEYLNCINALTDEKQEIEINIQHNHQAHQHIISSTPSFQTRIMTNSLLEEMQAAGSFIESTSEMDYSFDVGKESLIELTNNNEFDNLSVRNLEQEIGIENSHMVRQSFVESSVSSSHEMEQNCGNQSELARVVADTSCGERERCDSHQNHFVEIKIQKTGIATQTEVFSTNKLTQTSPAETMLEIEMLGGSAAKTDQYSQTHVESNDVKIQTDFPNDVTEPVPALRKDLNVQSEFLSKKRSLCSQSLDSSLKTGIHERKRTNQMIFMNGIEKYRLDSRNLQVASYNGIKNSDNTEEPNLESTVSVSSPVTLSYGDRLNNNNIQNPQELDPKGTELVSPSVMETKVCSLSMEKNHNSRFCSTIGFIFLFVFLLVGCTIVLTAAILDVASETGALYRPYYGSVPKWVKWLIRPAIKVTRHNRAL